MNVIVGFVLVIGCVLGGYMALGGKLAVLNQPFELLIIGGAALGAFVASNTKTIMSGTGKSLKRMLSGPRHKQDGYVELLSLLYQMFKLARAKGDLAIEEHIENPEESAIFTMFPKVMGDSHAMQFLCDYLRLLTMGSDKPHELESLMDQDMETHHDEENAVVTALRSVADSLPAIGIIAAVLGVIKTMASITEPPEVLGYLIGAALVGTFLGILLSYGFVGPMAAMLSNVIDSDAKYYQCMKTGLLAHVSGQPPMIAVEFARKTLPTDVRPNFYELEAAFDSLPPVAN